MSTDLSEKLRDLSTEMLGKHEHRYSSIVSIAAHRIEHLEQQLSEYKGMLEDAEHFRDHWYDRYLQMIRRDKIGAT